MNDCPGRRSALNGVKRSRRATAAAALTSLFLLAGCSQSPEEMLDSAKGYLQKNDLSAASIQLKNALQEDANLVEARFLLGKVNLETRDLPGAVKELERALQLGYSREQVVPLLARALVRSGEFDRVLDDFGDDRFDTPAAKGTLLAALGDARMGKAEPAKAVPLYEAALAADPEQVDARIGLSRARLFSGEIDLAESVIREALQAHPDRAEVHASLAEILFVRQQPAEAVSALQEALRLDPRNVGYHFTVITELMRANRVDEARDGLDALKKVAPSHPSTLYLQAFLDFRDNRFTAARDGVQQALKAAPDFLPAHLLAGTVMVRLGDQLQARTHLNRVLERAPGQPLARRMLVASHLATGEAARAAEYLQPLLDAGMQDPQTLGLAGQVFMANGDLEKAEDFLGRAASAAPEDAGARLRLGIARMAAGDAEHGLTDLETAAGMDQDAVQADVALVMAHLRRGDFDKALAAQDQLERKQADSAMVYNLRGGLMMAKRDTEAARAAFEKALSIDPDHLAAIVNLSRLDLAAQRPNDALGRLRAAVERRPDSAETRLAYAEFQRLTGAPAAAVLASLNEAEKALPGSLPVRLALIQHHLRSRDFPSALSAAQAAVAANPRDTGALGALAQAQIASGEQRQAIATLERLAETAPNSPAPLIQIADLQRANEDLASAEQTLRRALAIQPESAELQRRLADVLSARGDHRGALAIAASMQRVGASEAAGHLVEADVQARRGEWEAAAKAYRAALERAPRGEVLVRLHAVLTRLERKDEAAKVADDWLRAQPRDLVVRGYLAERALAEKQYPEAARQFGEMHEIAPQNALVLNNLAWSANQTKDPKALEYAEQAHALAPDNAAILDTLGVIQIERGQTEKGFANLERAVEIAPETTQLRLNLARAYADAGRRADARKQLDIVLPNLTEDSPLHGEATALIKSL